MSSLWSKIGMENLDENQILEKEKEYKPSKVIRFQSSKKVHYLIEVGTKFVFFTLGVSITILLYQKCLFNPQCNTVVTTYFALLGLLFFGAAGLFPVEKLIGNIKLT